jgi:ABC-type uncharacterized transport system substrate-binding protein
MALAGGKILYIDSYHEGYEWSDGITRGVQSMLEGTDVELKIFRMDTKRNTSKNFIRKAAVDAKMLIEEYQPDVVIASDDNASNYLIEPFYKDADLPFVFCGINWDASMYGYPYKNATGMVEVASVPELLELLKPYAKGDRLAYLAADVTTARKEGLYYRKMFDLEVDERYVKTFAEWADVYAKLQNECDLLIFGNNAGINDWDDAQAEQVVMKETQIPTGALYDFLEQFALIGYTKVAEEQGEWAAKAALQILNGTDIGTIPITTNIRGNLSLNLKLAKKLGIEFPEDILTSANRVIE